MRAVMTNQRPGWRAKPAKDGSVNLKRFEFKSPVKPGDRMWLVRGYRGNSPMGPCPACGGTGKVMLSGVEYTCPGSGTDEEERVWWCENGLRSTRVEEDREVFEAKVVNLTVTCFESGGTKLWVRLSWKGGPTRSLNEAEDFLLEDDHLFLSEAGAKAFLEPNWAC